MDRKAAIRGAEAVSVVDEGCLITKLNAGTHTEPGLPTIRAATWEEDAPHIRAIRREVFHEEQGVPLELDFDGEDSACLHALGFVDAQPVATGRMVADGHIGRVAVLKEWRGRGVGSALVDFLVAQAAQRGCGLVYLNSQCSAVGFYVKLGFCAVGDTFVEAGIDHVRMEKTCERGVEQA